MAKTRQQKEEAILTLSTAIKDSKAVVFANFQGLKVSEMEELRKKCRAEQIECVASKKTLVQVALKNAGIEGAETTGFEGGVAAFFGQTDEVAPAQIVALYAKDHEVLRVFGGVLEGRFIDTEKVLALSKLPSKQALLQQLVGSLNAPITGFVRVLSGNLRGLVTVLSVIKDKKAA